MSQNLIKQALDMIQDLENEIVRCCKSAKLVRNGLIQTQGNYLLALTLDIDDLKKEGLKEMGIYSA